MPPLLLSVIRALPSSIQGIGHILQLVNSFLIPRTVDAAVYNDLQTVLRVFGASRPWTAAAMDGAAARGRLDILQWLHDSRPEGCSAESFIAAASNDYPDVLQWLIHHYPELHDQLRCLTAAAGAGHLNVVRSQRPMVNTYNMTSALEAAAANNHVEVLEALRPWPFTMNGPFDAAVANGSVEAVRYLIERRCIERVPRANAVLEMAVRCARKEVVELLLPKCDSSGASRALRSAVESRRPDVVKLLLAKCTFNTMSMSLALDVAARNDDCDVVKLLLEHCTGEEESVRCDSGREIPWGVDICSASADKRSVMQRFISVAFRAAMKRGSIEMVKVLVGKLPSEAIGDSLHEAAACGKHRVVDFLLHECKTRRLDDSIYNSSVGFAVEIAADCGDLEMAKLLVGKCTPANAGRALNIAGANKRIDIVELFARKSGAYFKYDPYKVEALVQAAKDNQIAAVELLSNYIDQPTIEEALMRLPSRGHADATKLLLDKSEPGAVKRIFANAARNGLVELTAILLDHMDASSIRWALMSASSGGHVPTVKVLLRKSNIVSIGCALEAAAMTGQLGVAEVLRDQCDAASISAGVARASVNDQTEMVQLLRGKSQRLG
ncbi:hypothetical protein PHYPSEUDO_003213 [Phytophthora pseudosyringae]|uniref:Uncharacterized protein n=1 Tax=Phytophthora pseudosyringae TaxID=221518 RepID=A0A8T1VVH6_9STRA|nr:hypothetical protein PHYPSEUDO_003213 [Phytophthora pseudosyringae]